MTNITHAWYNLLYQQLAELHSFSLCLSNFPNIVLAGKYVPKWLSALVAAVCFATMLVTIVCRFNSSLCKKLSTEKCCQNDLSMV